MSVFEISRKSKRVFVRIFICLIMSNSSEYHFCEIKEISPLYRIFNEYKNQEMMYTIVLWILLLYLEEFLFVFRKYPKNDNREMSFGFL